MQDTRALSLLREVVEHTDLLTRNAESLTGIVSASRQSGRRALPVLPDVFGFPGGSESAAADEYCERFTAHLALEQRCDVLANYEELVTHCLEGGWKREKATQEVIRQRGKNHAKGAPGPADVWWQQTPLHPHVTRLAIAVTKTRSDATQIMIKAVTGENLTKLRKQLHTDKWKTHLRDPRVELAARRGIVPVLYPDTIVVVFIPLASCADVWLGARRTGAAVEHSASALANEARRVLKSLPGEWVAMGCIPRLARVSGVNFGRDAVELELYPMHAARADMEDVLDRLCGNRQWETKPFFVAELCSLNGVLMELEALHSIDGTRFAATLYDPRHTAPQSAAFYDWATSLLTDAGPRRAAPLLPMLRARLLLQQQLNDWQIRAIAAVLFAACPGWDDGVAEQSTQAAMPRAPEVLLIEGPPGTGKTQAIGSLTLNLVHHLGRVRGTAPRVLVCAPSNCAVDEALLRVVRLRKQLSEAAAGAGGGDGAVLAQRPADAVLSGRLLRIGVREKVDAKVLKLAPRVFLDDIVTEEVGREPASGKGSQEFYKRRKEAKEVKVKAAVVVFSTLGALRSLKQLDPRKFDVVIVDEASQCTEPAVLQALHLTASKCVLVGDTNQLQPTVISKEACERGLRRSLLMRLLACKHRSFMLRTQYRMHPDIVAFPNAYFYDSQLLTDESVHERSLVPVDPTATPKVAQRLGQRPRFVFVDVTNSQMERRRGRSLQNPREAAAVVDCMRQLRTFFAMSLAEMAEQIGIITPYTAQKELLESLLRVQEREAGIVVSTVDSSQGKEKCIILLSLVRTLSPAQQLRLKQQERRRRRGVADSDDDGSDLTTAEELEANAHVFDSCGLGFLADWRRLNVAKTRAKDLFICFGNAATIERAGAAAQAAGGGGARRRRRLTTLRDSEHNVIHALRADAEDPLALYCMLQHAREPTAYAEPGNSSSAAATPAAAVVEYREGTSLMALLVPRVAGTAPTGEAPSAD